MARPAGWSSGFSLQGDSTLFQLLRSGHARGPVRLGRHKRADRLAGGAAPDAEHAVLPAADNHPAAVAGIARVLVVGRARGVRPHGVAVGIAMMDVAVAVGGDELVGVAHVVDGGELLVE